MPAFNDFIASFFALYTTPQFRNQDFRAYAARPAAKRSGDEASIVDNALTAPLLALLGFSSGEQTYNQNNRHGRPDFAPTASEYGVCFVVEDKATGLDLTTDLTDPESHLSQLTGYLRGMGLRSGWLMNGRRLMVWSMDNPASPTRTLDFDISAALNEWGEGGEGANGGAANLSPATKQALNLLWERYRRETFADLTRLEAELALESAAWEAQALPVGANSANQELLVGAVKTLLQDLQADARARLDNYLHRYAEYARRRELVRDNDEDRAEPLRNQRRETAEAALNTLAPLVGLTAEETQQIRDDLRTLQTDSRAFLNTQTLMDKTRQALNTARARTFVGNRRASRALNDYDGEFGPLGDALKNFGDAAFDYHKRQGILRYDARDAIVVQENYALWQNLVQESMLGEMDEDARRNEFALQAAYIVFIRLMLIRVCEDKGILRHRLLSDGGLKRWREDMDRYFQFANGNPYNTLLNIAFENAQNIYAHFFTGRELFNWYILDRVRFVRSLASLSRFNFADVDSDLIGTIYNTYVERPEKKKKGQYYTPAAIVNYMLDEAGYVSGPAIIGPNKRLIDPACGSGKFLVEAARRLTAAYKAVGNIPPRQALNSIRDNIYGFDLNPFACYLAEVNLLLQCLDLVKEAIADGRAPRLQRFHIYNVDALSQGSGVAYYARNPTLMAEEMDVVERIKGRRDEFATGFGWVVANPPYGATLTDNYKSSLRGWWPEVFYGQPDTYVFFFAFALHLLGEKGRLAFITPNTYLMGTNAAALRRLLLNAGRITEIVDLPQGIWKDANVDCALLFLHRDADLAARRNQQTAVYSLDVRAQLDKLTARAWQETLSQPQSSWMDDRANEIKIRWSSFLTQIEEACRIPLDDGVATKIQRIGDATDSSAGVDPYHTSADGQANLYIKPKREVPQNETEWKPLLDGDSYVGRYEMRWAKHQPYLKYGRWLARARDPKYFDLPKLFVVHVRNRALKRRLVATYDDKGYYSRKNFEVIIAKNPEYNLKYILALFNSSLLNYWYARQFDNVTINPDYFRQLPIYPADAATQTELAGKVDELLQLHATLNAYREQGCILRNRRDGTREITLPYDILLREMQQRNPHFAAYTLFDARAAQLLTLPDTCDPDAQISRVFTPARYPNTVVLRANALYLTCDDERIRRYLLNYLSRPQWKNRSWNEIAAQALLPDPDSAFDAFFTEEAARIAALAAILDQIAATDRAIDDRILDLYGITAPADRARILGSAPPAEEDPAEAPDENNEGTEPNTLLSPNAEEINEE